MIIAKQPNSAEVINKIIPYQGIIGLVLFIWGIIEFFSSIKYWDWMFRASAFYGIVYILSVLASIVIGFILGYGILDKLLLSKNKEAENQGSKLFNSLQKLQIPFGFIGLILAIIMFLYNIGVLSIVKYYYW